VDTATLVLLILRLSSQFLEARRPRQTDDDTCIYAGIPLTPSTPPGSVMMLRLT